MLAETTAAIPVSWWVAFNGFVIFMLALDLGVFNRKAHVVKLKEALGWTAVWIALAMVFNLWVGWKLGADDAKEFLAGYILEKSLSVDNVFVFAVIFSFFKVPREYQHKVLFWGIFGALALRAVMIAGGAALITNFAWIIYIFAALLVFTGFKMFFHDENSVDPGKSIAIRLLKKVMPITPGYEGSKFLVKKDGRWFATPLFAVLLCVEVTDVIFAVDSIPAIFAITTDTFIVYTSNVFAILGLRSLYFAIAGILPYFHFLKYGLGVILIFVGVKMSLAHSQWKIDTNISLGVIAGVLAISVIASIIHRKRHPLPENTLESGNE
ncbi:TerC family protein [Luteolibacter sp. GHJ8]|uniref:TerC family protein n=1 Tax=Luteolibacter rhizosphaerae TaxID=2989719 RepID=A0ABT3G5X4_9BACT|nr:TerC family protein [Luteolibacter rhizosphaerae]MCW1915225.1 TerC family protein [Luteolibacter rhizosphaerae]